MASKEKLPVVIEKPTPYTFDVGGLCAFDPNPLIIEDATRIEESLQSTARDGAQSLINQLLTTCPITPTSAGVLLAVGDPTFALPREKPIPQAAPETRWAAFARRRGIKPKTREQRRNLQYDQPTGEFRRRWGYKGLNKAGEDDAIIELKDHVEAKREKGTTVRGDRRREIRERVRKNERQMRRNERNAAGGGGKR